MKRGVGVVAVGTVTSSAATRRSSPQQQLDDVPLHARVNKKSQNQNATSRRDSRSPGGRHRANSASRHADKTAMGGGSYMAWSDHYPTAGEFAPLPDRRDSERNLSVRDEPHLTSLDLPLGLPLAQTRQQAANDFWAAE